MGSADVDVGSVSGALGSRRIGGSFRSAHAGQPSGALFATLEVRVTSHFLRRLEERGGDPDRLFLEGDRLVASGWLRPIHRHDYGWVVPGFGQIRLRLDRHGPRFVAVTFLPIGGS